MAAILLILPVSLSACSSDLPDDPDQSDGSGSTSNEWMEIQSITYSTDAKTDTITSEYVWICEDRTPIEMDEYLSAPNDQHFPYSLADSIDIEKEQIPDNPSQYFGKTYYARQGYIYFKQVKIVGFETRYVKIKLFDNGSIDLNYHYQNGSYVTKHILPISYEITYFI